MLLSRIQEDNFATLSLICLLTEAKRYKGSYMTGISTPPTHQVLVISRRLCSGWLRPGSPSAHVCSGLLTHLTRHRQLLARDPKRPPFPAKGSQICSHYTFTTCVSQNSFSDSYSRLSVFMQNGTCLTSFSAVCLGLRTL